jgi:hypothetical protein
MNYPQAPFNNILRILNIGGRYLQPDGESLQTINKPIRRDITAQAIMNC